MSGATGRYSDSGSEPPSDPLPIPLRVSPGVSPGSPDRVAGRTITDGAWACEDARTGSRDRHVFGLIAKRGELVTTSAPIDVSVHLCMNQ
jgi:hypothetical protein